MGNTCAWPVLRTTDLDEAVSLAERLLSVASWYDPDACYLDAWARTESDLRRLTAAFPEAEATSYGEGRTGDGQGRTGLPVSVNLGLGTVPQARDALGTCLNITMGYVLWHNLKWPEVPELGLGEEYKYAELQIAGNSHTIHSGEWAPEHTVFVHARPGHDARAAWLAARVGAEVVGPSEEGW
ncbi:hypothetical protein [Streptomyces poonensis]|uniref:Uncharacterized protein n=1 Tax=Streptomyces poonensis TaxID=68255 RepID=A0A918PQW0_9ACTN|nr:hypothetical protein [Streptomyces poonensis]GGZ18027.1 hypothetical protein GCM10010365_42670 [Streptomyces poonensis]GLJ91047.1 hypothetical protein GCM10017589_36530 [Streptomyces poonensis]